MHTNSASPVLGKRQIFLLLIYFLFTTIIPIFTFPLYADDAKCFRELLSLDDHDALQKDLYSIEDWSDLWGPLMVLNANILVSLKRISLRIHLINLVTISSR